MRLRIAEFFALQVLLVSSSAATAAAQAQPLDLSSLLARVSYNIGPSMVEWGSGQSYPRACFAVYRGGYYQISRMTEQGDELLEGKLSGREFSELGKMLASLDFKSSGGGMVRQGAERFVAELARADRPQYYVWMNPDHRNPFPDSAVRIVEWLAKFKAEGSSPLSAPRDLNQPSICPPASGSPLQPLTAGLAPRL